MVVPALYAVVIHQAQRWTLVNFAMHIRGDEIHAWQRALHTFRFYIHCLKVFVVVFGVLVSLEYTEDDILVRT